MNTARGLGGGGAARYAGRETGDLLLRGGRFPSRRVQVGSHPRRGAIEQSRVRRRSGRAPIQRFSPNRLPVLSKRMRPARAVRTVFAGAARGEAQEIVAVGEAQSSCSHDGSAAESVAGSPAAPHDHRRGRALPRTRRAGRGGDCCSITSKTRLLGKNRSILTFN